MQENPQAPTKNSSFQPSGEIGEELAFILPMRLNPFAKSPLVKNLIDRVDRARNT